jgi:hypothetical protein
VNRFQAFTLSGTISDGLPAHIRPDFSRLILENVVIVGVTLVAVLTTKGEADWGLRAIARRASGCFNRYQQAALILTLLCAGIMLVSGQLGGSHLGVCYSA